MKKILLIPALLFIGFASQLSAANYSVSIFLDARVGGYIVGGGRAFEQFEDTIVTNADGTTSLVSVKTQGKAIGAAADEIDDSEITFKATVDNVDAQVKFERTAANNTVIKFDSAYIQVNDIFGLLTIRFYDWGYAAGSSKDEGEYILSDIGFQGFYGSIKPIDILSLGFGFGLNANSIRGIRFDMQIGGPVPTGIYLGIVVNSSDNETLNNTDAAIGGVAPGDRIGKVKEGTIERLQLGFESKLYGDYIKLSFGITPFGTTIEYYKTTVDTSAGTRVHTVADDITMDDPGFVFDISGDASFLDGLVGLGYGFLFSYDTITKVMSAGRQNFFSASPANSTVANSSGVATVFPSNHSYQALFDDGADLLELFDFRIIPSVSIGQFVFSLPFVVEYYGDTYSGIKLREKPYIRLEINPTVKWTPAKGMTITAIMGIDLATRSLPVVGETVGDLLLVRGGADDDFGLEDVYGELRIGASFGVSSEE
ncbi:hypothetical protein COTS27_01091 [Spirochaetota bacterium]|nr:hypothetical protein COTS27_01091 [Spirochaetota bacterium]